MHPPMCTGSRHIYMTGSDRCRCGAERAAKLNSVEAKIAGFQRERHEPQRGADDGCGVGSEVRRWQHQRWYRPAGAVVAAAPVVHATKCDNSGAARIGQRRRAGRTGAQEELMRYRSIGLFASVAVIGCVDSASSLSSASLAEPDFTVALN